MSEEKKPTTVEEAEALVIVMAAIDLGRSLGVEEGVLVGHTSTAGRFVIYSEGPEAGHPAFDEPQEAAVWICVGDLEEAVNLSGFDMALKNWKRLSPDADRDGLVELGNDLANAIENAFSGGTFGGGEQ